VPGVERVLVVDGLAAAAGGAASASSVTTYIESSAGIAEGARTGLAAVVTGALFLAAMLLAPFAALITAEATAAALILVGVLMARELPLIDFSRLEEGLPALLTVLVMPFTYSITNGIGAGFLMYTFLQVVRGKGGDVRPMMYVVSAAFLVYFLIPVAQRLMGW
jgi:adenine/guanine/hypoxanthine permease